MFCFPVDGIVRFRHENLSKYHLLLLKVLYVTAYKQRWDKVLDCVKRGCVFILRYFTMLQMDTFTEVGQSEDVKSSSKFDFMRKKGFKRGVFLLIILTFLSTVYTFVNKLSSPNINEIYQGLFSKMKEEIRNLPIMNNILKIVTNATAIENLKFE